MEGEQDAYETKSGTRELGLTARLEPGKNTAQRQEKQERGERHG